MPSGVEFVEGLSPWPTDGFGLERIQPLLRTRGPPATHDVALACRVLDDLRAPVTTRIPSFDKATDVLCEQFGCS